METESIQVKSYLFPRNCEINCQLIKRVTEIRRFVLPAVVGSNEKLYETLIEKIRKVFGDLVEKKDLKLFWQDEENDLVGFSSNEELEFALHSAETKKPFRVYVACKQQQQQQQPNKSEEIFIGHGYGRRPWGVCPGLRARQQQRHATATGSGSNLNAKNASQQNESSQNEEPVIHYGVVCDSCDGSVIGSRFKCKICPDYDLCNECKDKGNIHTEHEFEEIKKQQTNPFKRMNAGRPQYPHPNFQQMFNDFMPNLTREMNRAANPENLRNAGEYIKTMLTPLGIDVDYYVDNINKMNQNQAASTSTSAAAAAANSETEAKKSETTKKQVEEKEEKVLEERSEEEIKKNSSVGVNNDDNEEEEVVEMVTEPKKVKRPEETTSSSSSIDITPFEKASQQLKNIIEKQDDAKVITPSAPTINGANQDEQQQQQQMETESLNPAAAGANNFKTSEVDDGFNLVDIEKEMKIIRTLEQLKEMGYSDDGGWLTRLASAKHGHLNAVLDAITPNKQA